MKKSLLAILTIISLGVFANGSLTIKGHGDISFTVLINNTPQSNQSKNKHIIEDIPQGNYSITIETQNPYFKKTRTEVFVKSGMNKTYKVFKRRNGYNIVYMNRTRTQKFVAPARVCGTTTNIQNEEVIVIDGNNGNYGNLNNNYNNYNHNNGYTNHNNYNNETVIIRNNNGCYGPVSNREFAEIRRSILNQSFTAEKKMVAKQAISNRCLSTTQVKQLIRLFSFDSAKLEIAKHGYSYVHDPANYYSVNDVFSFSSSIRALDKHINANKRL